MTLKPGDRFNRWTAIRFDERRGPNYRWLFRCDCGTEKVVGTSGITSGGSKSCGCLRKEVLATLRPGEVFSRLTAVKPCAGRHSYWHFKCVCGKDHVAKIYEVRHGAIRSCGCLRDERLTPSINIGDVFSDLTAIKSVHGATIWTFKCACGNERNIRAARVVNGRIKSCGCRRSLYEIGRARAFSSKKSRISRMFSVLKRGARLRGIPFEIQKSDIERLAEVQGWRCAQTGLMLDLTSGDGLRPFGPTIDRINNDRGYEPGNIQLVCYMYNMAKNQFTDADVREFAGALLGHSKINLLRIA